jgi:hypothetical protein
MSLSLLSQSSERAQSGRFTLTLYSDSDSQSLQLSLVAEEVVPEPTAWTLAVLAMIGGCVPMWRRRRARR